MAQQKRMKRGGVMGALIALLVLACLTCAGFLGYYIFQVEHIEVQGNHLFSTTEIIALSGIKTGENLFSVSAEKIKANFSSQPYLNLVKLERKWPSTILLHISEREAIAAISYDKQYLLVAEDGTMLKAQGDVKDYIVVDGMGVTAAAMGAVLTGPSSYQLYVMKLVCERIRKSACAASIVKIDLRDPAAIVLTTSGGINIRLGTEENLEGKFVWIENILPRLEQEGKHYGTLDVTGTNGASYIP